MFSIYHTYLDKGTPITDIRDKATYKKVFNLFYRELVVYAHNFLYNLQASEDLVQDVFIQLWENSHELNIHTSIKSYLYASVRNKCYNRLRDIKIEDDLNLIDLNANLTSDYEMEGHEPQEKQKVYQQVMDVVEEFPDNMKRIFQLKFFEDYKYADIAEEMGISINSVKTQLKRAKAKINEAIAFIVFLLTYF
ncbi:RNA polymerase sigma-70 factor [Muricauda oceani]|uniref:RNA polymerase sigma-70 factor n=1 Tax=Flagellimonas oceani TaxID=2698672 RepID=A0A6G7IZE2_9FLAO|nr:RNA polymerase sigma-70 factor [Allomuricauda oceani]MBW8243660.1 RNA polymerase sigma-70 factor [Allomuricauda oceani]QII43973.1 RNA polymerase sigma-70 factor [Allomuricauda oceani]